jgi:hypothetical protein
VQHAVATASPRRPSRTCRYDEEAGSRIERGAISPSVSTVACLLAAMGERLELHAVRAREHRADEELRADLEQLTAGERIAQTWCLTGVGRTFGGSHKPCGPDRRREKLRRLAQALRALGAEVMPRDEIDITGLQRARQRR